MPSREDALNTNNCVGSQKNALCLLTASALASLSQGANAGTTLPNNVTSTCFFTPGGIQRHIRVGKRLEERRRSAGSDGFSGGLSHIWASILPLFP
jgi:hypothetical protein